MIVYVLLWKYIKCYLSSNWQPYYFFFFSVPGNCINSYINCIFIEILTKSIKQVSKQNSKGHIFINSTSKKFFVDDSWCWKWKKHMTGIRILEVVLVPNSNQHMDAKEFWKKCSTIGTTNSSSISQGTMTIDDRYISFIANSSSKHKLFKYLFAYIQRLIRHRWRHTRHEPIIDLFLFWPANPIYTQQFCDVGPIVVQHLVKIDPTLTRHSIFFQSGGILQCFACFVLC